MPVQTPHAVLLLPVSPPAYERYVTLFRAEFPEVLLSLVRPYETDAECLTSADCLLTFSSQVTDTIVRNADRLRWIQCLGSGTDEVLQLPSLSRSVAVTNVRGIHGPAMSEAILSAMLALSRDLPRTIRAQAERRWDRVPPKLLDGKTVTIVGVGRVAEVFAPRARALGMRTIGVSARTQYVTGFDEIRPKAQVASAVRQADFLVLLAPPTAINQRLIDERILSAMKPTSFLVNVSRAGLVDTEALLRCLTSKSIAGAAVDVFEREPLPPDHPLWSLPNVLITPHLGGLYEDYPERSMVQVCENMRHFLSGNVESLINLVRPSMGS